MGKWFCEAGECGTACPATHVWQDGALVGIRCPWVRAGTEPDPAAPWFKLGGVRVVVRGPDGRKWYDSRGREAESHD